MKLICCKDVFSENVMCKINELLSSKNNFIYLSATKSILSERKSCSLLTPYFEANSNVYSSKEFINFINTQIRKDKNYLSNFDLHYILIKIIEQHFLSDDRMCLSYKNDSYNIFKLFKFLIFHNQNEISGNILDVIKRKYSRHSYHIFKIYNRFIKVLENIVRSVRKGILPEEIQNLSVEIKTDFENCSNFDIFINSQKRYIKQTVLNSDIVIMDGYFSFNDQERYIIECAEKASKELIFIFKDINENPIKEFLINEVYGYNLKDSNIEILNLDSEIKKNKRSAVDIVGQKFNRIDDIDIEDENLMDDGSINIITPFLNRDHEFKYIANKIAEISKENKCNNEESIRRLIENDILVVSAVDRDMMCKQFNMVLEKSGIFLFKSIPEDLFDSKIKNLEIQPIYYDSKSFTDKNITFEDGTLLTLDQKNTLFKKSFLKIEIPSQKRSIINSPIIEFIFQLYSIANDGINVQKFKMLLFSNWYYHTGQSEFKWDDLVGVFEQIQVYFFEKSDISEWIKELENILHVRDTILHNKQFRHHPFIAIEKTKLENLLSVLNELKILSLNLSQLKGNFEFHVNFLKNNIIHTSKIFDLETEKLTSGQKLIRDFYNVIKKSESDSLIQNLDSNFFIQHLKNILLNIELELPENVSNNSFSLNVVNMLNLKKYKYVFFIGLENNKYPRKHKKNFPFTDEIIDIINLLEVKSYELDIIKNNIKMERHFFNNIFDFTLNKLWLTCTQFATSNCRNNFSIYIEDIFTIFGRDYFELHCSVTSSDCLPMKNQIQLSPMYAPLKDTYTLKELITFLLCPKLYYHLYVIPTTLAFKNKNQLKLYTENVFYIELLYKFMDYNYNNKKWYKFSEHEYQPVLLKLLSESFNEIKDCFNFLDPYELDAMKNNALSRVTKFITDSINYLGYKQFTIVRAKPQKYNCGNYNVLTEYDTAIYSIEKGNKKINQNELYLDLLVLKSTDNEIKTIHYKDMVTQLKSNSRYLDRVFLANRMINKINIQFESNVKKFIYGYDGAMERIGNLVNNITQMDFATVKPHPSNFCQYCIVRDVCMGGKENVKLEGVFDEKSQ